MPPQLEAPPPRWQEQRPQRIIANATLKATIHIDPHAPVRLWELEETLSARRSRELIYALNHRLTPPTRTASAAAQQAEAQLYSPQ